MSAAVQATTIADAATRAPLAASARALQHELLVDVSRTFALTIPRLPPVLADVVGNGYLLCRIVDTIEDELTSDEATRDLLYERFNQCLRDDALENGQWVDDFARDFASLLPATAPEGEVHLVARIPDILGITASFTADERRVLRDCVGVMTRGMRDFAAPGASGHGLDTSDTLHRYCYHVAGCVGEMLTELFCLHDAHIAARRDKLLPMSLAFGRGLQLTNVLKDMWIDQQRGVCWLPRDVFFGNTGGLETTRDARGEDPALADLMQRAVDGDAAAIECLERGTRVLVGQCRRDLDTAMRYVRTIPRRHRGLRIFCLWSIGLSVLTLRKIGRQTVQQRRLGTKVSRRSVKATMIMSGASAGLAPVMQGLYSIACIGLPSDRT